MAIKYKIIKHPSGNSSRDQIEKIGMCTIPRDLGNLDYQQFLQDVKENGNDIVEGPEVVVRGDYKEKRTEAYPPIGEQLGKTTTILFVPRIFTSLFVMFNKDISIESPVSSSINILDNLGLYCQSSPECINIPKPPGSSSPPSL